MKILVTGSAGHLGEALMRTLEMSSAHSAFGADVLPSPYTRWVGSITDRGFARECVRHAEAVLHAATLHQPHLATHAARDFVDTNITGTLNLLEEAVAAGVRAFVFSSTTSAFGRALTPAAGQPASWITEDVVPIPRNIYGVSKVAAENLCELFQHRHGLPCIVLRTSRFFPEADDDVVAREAYPGDNLKVNELCYRRLDLEDAVSAHLLALQRAPEIGFGRYILSATTPFRREDMVELRADAAAIIRRRFPQCELEYARRGWSLPRTIDRVYVNERARAELGWQPRHDFAGALERLQRGVSHQSELALAVGSKGYHRKG
jgi:UDP-glucose 4-epimerase